MLRPFAAAGCAGYYDVEHLIGVWWFVEFAFMSRMWVGRRAVDDLCVWALCGSSYPEWITLREIRRCRVRIRMMNLLGMVNPTYSGLMSWRHASRAYRGVSLP